MFENNFIMNLDQEMFDWVITEFEHLHDVLKHYIELRTGVREFDSYKFSHLLEYEGVDEAIVYLKNFPDYELQYSDFFDYERLINNSVEFIKKTKIHPVGEIICPMPDDFIIALNLRASHQTARYLIEHHTLIAQHDLFFKDDFETIPAAIEKMNVSLDELSFLEQKGYKMYVTHHHVMNAKSFDESKEILNIAERTEYPRNFINGIKGEIRKYGMSLPKFRSLVNQQIFEFERQSRSTMNLTRSQYRSISPVRSRSPR